MAIRPRGPCVFAAEESSADAPAPHRPPILLMDWNFHDSGFDVALGPWQRPRAPQRKGWEPYDYLMQNHRKIIVFAVSDEAVGTATPVDRMSDDHHHQRRQTRQRPQGRAKGRRSVFRSAPS
jgi:hypothetical protein